MKLKVLFAYGDLAERASVEFFARDLCIELIRNGHEVVILSSHPGAILPELEGIGVRLVAHIDEVGSAPDVIQTSRRYDAILTSLRFPQTPLVWFLHGGAPWIESPPRLPSVRQHVVCDYAWQEPVARDLGADENDVVVLPLFFDPERCASRLPLPEKPERAVLIDGNRQGTHIPFVRVACRRHGVDLDVFEEHSDTVSYRIPDIVSKYDLVFARGQVALEAIAVGCAVVPCDEAGCGELVTKSNVLEMWTSGFGRRIMTEPLMPRTLERILSTYDAKAIEACSQFVQAYCSTEAVTPQVTDLYENVITSVREHPNDTAALCIAAAKELASIGEYGDSIRPSTLRDEDRAGGLKTVGQKFKSLFKGSTASKE